MKYNSSVGCNSTWVDEARKSWSLLTIKMEGMNRSGEEREEPGMWPRTCVATSRKREKKGEHNKWDEKKTWRKQPYVFWDKFCSVVKRKNNHLCLWDNLCRSRSSRNDTPWSDAPFKMPQSQSYLYLQPFRPSLPLRTMYLFALLICTLTHYFVRVPTEQSKPGPPEVKVEVWV